MLNFVLLFSLSSAASFTGSNHHLNAFNSFPNYLGNRHTLQSIIDIGRNFANGFPRAAVHLDDLFEQLLQLANTLNAGELQTLCGLISELSPQRYRAICSRIDDVDMLASSFGSFDMKREFSECETAKLLIEKLPTIAANSDLNLLNEYLDMCQGNPQLIIDTCLDLKLKRRITFMLHLSHKTKSFQANGEPVDKNSEAFRKWVWIRLSHQSEANVKLLDHYTNNIYVNRCYPSVPVSRTTLSTTEDLKFTFELPSHLVNYRAMFVPLPKPRTNDPEDEVSEETELPGERGLKRGRERNDTNADDDSCNDDSDDEEEDAVEPEIKKRRY